MKKLTAAVSAISLVIGMSSTPSFAADTITHAPSADDLDNYCVAHTTITIDATHKTEADQLSATPTAGTPHPVAGDPLHHPAGVRAR